MSAPPTAGAGVDLALALQDVSVRFGGVKALSDVTLDIGRDERVGVIGPNGAGKSTLVNVISGQVRPTAGTVRFAGRPFEKQPAYRRARAGLARSFQNLELSRRLTIGENVQVAIEGPRQLARRGSEGLSRRKREARRRELLSLFEISSFGDRSPDSVPYGVLKRAELARTFALGGSLILLDEPAAGLNLSEKAALSSTLVRALGETGCSALVIEHDMSVIQAVTDRVYVLEQGRIIAAGTFNQVSAQEVVQRAYLGPGHDEGT